MQTLALAIVMMGVFALGWYLGHWFTKLSEDTQKELEELRERIDALRSNYASARLRAAVLLDEIHKLNRAFRRRSRQLENLKKKMRQAGVPIHSPGTRRVIAVSAAGRLQPALSSGAADSKGIVSHSSQSLEEKEVNLWNNAPF